MSHVGGIIVSDNHIESYGVHQAKREILSRFGDDIAIKPKSLLKFGQNTDVGTSSATIMTLPAGQLNETYVSSNLINSISSSSASDIEPIYYEGHTISGSNLTFVTGTVTLNGQTKIALPTSVARVTRAYNANGANLIGNIYFYEGTSAVVAGVPSDGTKVHLMIPAGLNQSRKAATAFSQFDYGIITSIEAALNQKTPANADVVLEYRELGSVFKTLTIISLGSQGSSSTFRQLEPFIVIPKNCDVRMIAVANTPSVSISASFNCYLGYVIN